MWIFSKVGFFSVVRNNQGDGVLVRARVRKDLVELRDTYAPTLGEITHDKLRDYPYRAKLSLDDLAQVMARIALDIDYSNFKSEVARRQGWERERHYHKVWDVMYDLEEKLKDDRRAPRMTDRQFLGEEPSRRHEDLFLQPPKLDKPKKKGKKTC